MVTSTSIATINPVVSLSLIDALSNRPRLALAAAVVGPSHGSLSGAEVLEVAELLGIDFAAAPFSVEELQVGMEVELELGYECGPSLVDAPDDDLCAVGQAAVAHLREQSDYYTCMSQAHAPGDPPPARHRHAELGSD